MMKNNEGIGFHINMQKYSKRDCKKRKSKIRTIIPVVLAILTAVFAISIVWENRTVELNKITVLSNRIPASFSGFKIVHISDLHNAEFGENNIELLRILEEAGPDIIVITGDLVDSRHTDFDISFDFAGNAMNIAPVYYVTGNHESRLFEFYKFEKDLEEAGVNVLRDESCKLMKNGEEILLIGLDDPQFTPYAEREGKIPSLINTRLKKLKSDSNTFTVLLSHRPEFFETYVSNDIDLVLSGHTHGGQFRIPFIGALIVPDQGIFPKYDAGLFASNNTTMIISRGLGNSIIPLRINCRSEIILVTLEKTKESS